MSAHAHNQHSLFVTFHRATESQIRSCIDFALAAASKALKREVSRDYKVNIVTTREGQPVGYAYLWMKSSEAYHLLLGRNPDGTARYREEPAPNWQPPIPIDKPITSSGSWADEMDAEDDQHPPIIRVPLPTLAPIPDYTYAPEQLDAPGDNNAVTGTISLKASTVNELEPEYNPSTLTTKVPGWINEAALNKALCIYSTGERRYPRVTINSKGWAYIGFDPMTRDAQFALQMIRKMVYRSGDRETVLVFKHAMRHGV